MIDHIRCSGLARPMTCAGSLFFTDLPEDEGSDAAKEGTAAGEYLERLLTGQPIGTHAENGVPFNDDMAFHTQPVCDEISSNTEDGVLCEQRIDWETRSGITIKGQYDASFVRDGVLYIDDLKYGWGIVEPTENWQLLGYAIGEVIRRGKAYSRIRLRIHQPRPHHEDGTTRSWELTYEQLLEYKEKIEARMDVIAAGEKGLITSKNCKYCKAAASCPAFNKAFFRGVEIAQQFVQDDLSDEELSFQLDLIDRVSDVMKTRKSSLETLAVHRLKNNKIIPNYASQTRYGDRSWKKGISPATIKMLCGKDITEKKVMTPAKAEKIGVPKDLIKGMVERKFLGQKLKRVDISKEADKIFGKPKE